MSAPNTTTNQSTHSHFQHSDDFRRVGDQIKELCESIGDLGEVVRKEILAYVDEAGDAWLAKHHPNSSHSSSTSSGAGTQDGKHVDGERK